MDINRINSSDMNPSRPSQGQKILGPQLATAQVLDSRLIELPPSAMRTGLMYALYRQLPEDFAKKNLLDRPLPLNEITLKIDGVVLKTLSRYQAQPGDQLKVELTDKGLRLINQPGKELDQIKPLANTNASPVSKSGNPEPNPNATKQPSDNQPTTSSANPHKTDSHSSLQQNTALQKELINASKMQADQGAVQANIKQLLPKALPIQDLIKVLPIKETVEKLDMAIALAAKVQKANGASNSDPINQLFLPAIGKKWNAVGAEALLKQLIDNKKDSITIQSVKIGSFNQFWNTKLDNLNLLQLGYLRLEGSAKEHLLQSIAAHAFTKDSLLQTGLARSDLPSAVMSSSVLASQINQYHSIDKQLTQTLLLQPSKGLESTGIKSTKGYSGNLSSALTTPGVANQGSTGNQFQTLVNSLKQELAATLSVGAQQLINATSLKATLNQSGQTMLAKLVGLNLLQTESSKLPTRLQPLNQLNNLSSPQNFMSPSGSMPTGSMPTGSIPNLAQGTANPLSSGPLNSSLATGLATNSLEGVPTPGNNLPQRNASLTSTPLELLPTKNFETRYSGLTSTDNQNARAPGVSDSTFSKIKHLLNNWLNQAAQPNKLDQTFKPILSSEELSLRPNSNFGSSPNNLPLAIQRSLISDQLFQLQSARIELLPQLVKQITMDESLDQKIRAEVTMLYQWLNKSIKLEAEGRSRQEQDLKLAPTSQLMQTLLQKIEQVPSRSEFDDGRNLLRLLTGNIARAQSDQLATLSSRNNAEPGQPQLIWQTSIPFLAEQQTQSLFLQIYQQDDNQVESPEQEKVWTLTLYFDLPNLGPLFCEAKLKEKLVERLKGKLNDKQFEPSEGSVSFWSDTPATLAAISQHQHILIDKINDLGIQIDTIIQRRGIPEKTKTQISSHLVDVRT